MQNLTKIMSSNSRVYAGLGTVSGASWCTLSRTGKSGVVASQSGRGGLGLGQLGWKWSGSEPLGQKLFENWQKCSGPGSAGALSKTTIPRKYTYLVIEGGFIRVPSGYSDSWCQFIEGDLVI